MISRILFAEDDASSREWIAEVLCGLARTVDVVEDGRAAIDAMSRGSYDLVITDLRMPHADGRRVLAEARRDGTEVIVTTAFGDVDTAVALMREGAADLLVKPLTPEMLEASIRRVVAARSLRRENDALRTRIEAVDGHASALIGEAPALRAAIDLAKRVAPTKAGVLIRGESGTGKELVANLIHAGSPRKDAPFVRVNCAALSESLLCSELFGHERGAFTGATARRIGRFELADGGTLFLDEIGEISNDVQAKLLRVLESGEFERVGGSTTLRVDVRVVAATNRPLEAAIAAGYFRRDLFHRLNVLPITLPPLRERRGDIAALADHFFRTQLPSLGGTAVGFTDDALAALEAHPWPGNVRELANTVARGLLGARGERVTAADLGLATTVASVLVASVDQGPTETLEEVERRHILKTLDACRGNRSEAARRLGVTVRTLFNKLKTWKERGAFLEAGV